MSIVLKDLTKTYGSQRALDNISFSIDSGEIVGFLGPNGAGKSTTMKILCGYIPQTSGLAQIMGMEVSKDPISVKKRIGYLPELNPLYPDMYVAEYLKFISDIHKIKGSKEAIERVIESTGLSLERKKKIGQLSKGYKQRVGLAQALLNDPEVLILDEPTSGLDPNQVTEIRKLILSLGKDKTILLSSHIMQEVEAMCSRVIIINKGKIVADDKVEVVKQTLSKKKSTTIVKFRSDINVKKLRAKSGVSEVIASEGSTYRVVAKSDIDLPELLFNFAIESKIIILEQKEEVESLESVFQQLTKNV
ncbi:ATP-binding cassette domain-containing protein [Bacteroidia bacterium]|nr:ATP-binding cassette domain-containing protein [Bacteroidia bacterium]|tara:strand:- start:181 stop:1095 length:915 start_codon:yes stop_codon:yes gene_type:complete